MPPGDVEQISAVTLVVRDMATSVGFYESLGFERRYGGPDSEFTSLLAGTGFVNLQLDPAWTAPDRVWGRVIFWVVDVDAVHDRAVAAGFDPEMAPSDAPWGERYFHLRDPDGHELSFARLLG
jgi:catechol 2,3-dioxygenase-like lactoylglutathione lyase family enzyme